MKTKTRSQKLLRCIALSTQVLAVAGLVSLSAHAQVPNQQQATQDKPADAVASVEPSSTGAGTLSAKPVAEPTIPPPSTNKWTGFYGGGHVGYGWGRADTSFTPLPTATQFFDMAPTTLRPDPKGVIAGGQVGFNKEFSPWVLGGEFSVSWSKMKGDATVTPIIRN